MWTQTHNENCSPRGMHTLSMQHKIITSFQQKKEQLQNAGPESSQFYLLSGSFGSTVDKITRNNLYDVKSWVDIFSLAARLAR